MKLVWDEAAWEDYVWWQGRIASCSAYQCADPRHRRNGNEGIGKPEPLEHAFRGHWSRRINDEHRLVYKVVGDEIRIAQCRYHYE